MKAEEEEEEEKEEEEAAAAVLSFHMESQEAAKAEGMGGEDDEKECHRKAMVIKSGHINTTAAGGDEIPGSAGGVDRVEESGGEGGLASGDRSKTDPKARLIALLHDHNAKEASKGSLNGQKKRRRKTARFFVLHQSEVRR
jgi:hypothetical protein